VSLPLGEKSGGGIPFTTPIRVTGPLNGTLVTNARTSFMFLAPMIEIEEWWRGSVPG
jgi:hypothetical protein